MAHYAFLDDNNIVTEVIVGIDETETIEGLDTETWYGDFRKQKCVRTSYNGKIRKQFAGIGFFYDTEADVFIGIKPYPSWILNENHDWQPPVAMPLDDKSYVWDESFLKWVETQLINLDTIDETTPE
jgi:hypothetical protein